MVALLVLRFKRLLKLSYMKSVGKGFIHHVYVITVVLLVILSLSACNVSGNVALNGKDQILDNLKTFQVSTAASLKTDTSKAIAGKLDTTRNNELTGDFRYDNLFK
jgi:hypothetical protein